MAFAMGLGQLGTSSAVFKRKFRWTLEFVNVCYNGSIIPPSYVKAANRPSLTIEETEINYLNGKMWIPGKGTQDTTTVTYYDVASADAAESIRPLFVWLSTVYDFTDPVNLKQSSVTKRQGSYTAQYGALDMLDGCGNPIERFLYYDPWPTQINFGDLDYSSNDECTIELTLRYRNFEYISQGSCAPTFEPECGGCES
jgi:hypothetical protein